MVFVSVLGVSVLGVSVNQRHSLPISAVDWLGDGWWVVARLTVELEFG